MEVDIAGIHKILAKGLTKKGKVDVQSFTGHMSSLSASQRDHIKLHCGNLQGFLQRYPAIYKLKNGFVKLTSVNSGNGTKMKKCQGAIADDKCDICDNIIEVHAIAECGHPMCYKCAVKWLVINQQNNCMYCKNKIEKITFSNTSDANRELNEKFLLQGEYGFYYEDMKIKKKVESLLKHACKECTSNYPDSQSLNVHLQAEHRQTFCKICLRSQKFFTTERKIYSLVEIAQHQNEEHKLCTKCQIYFFDKDELYHHMETQHFNCYICNSNIADDEDRQLYYFATIQELSEHIKSDHVYCKHCIHESPLESSFEGEKDLLAHMNYKHKKKKRYLRFEDFNIQMNKREDSTTNGITIPLTTSGLTHSKINPAGVKNSIGQVTGPYNAVYSFIQPYGSHDREDNVYFDIEALGLTAEEDLRDHLLLGDFVRFVSVEHSGHTARYKATDVVKISNDQYWEEVVKRNHASITAMPMPSNVNTQDGFPGITTTYPTQPAVWPVVKRTNSPKRSLLDVRNPTPSAQPKNSPFGYAYNIKSTYGFITRKQGRSEHDKNVYFGIQAFRNGLIMPQPVTALDKCISDGVKLFYELEDKPTSNPSHEAKRRAKKVWRALVSSTAIAPKPTTKLRISVTNTKSNEKPAEPKTLKKTKEKLSTENQLQLLDFRDDSSRSSSYYDFSFPPELENKVYSTASFSISDNKMGSISTPRMTSKSSMDNTIGDIRLISESDSLVVYENVVNDSQPSLTSDLNNSPTVAEENNTTGYNSQDSIYLQDKPLEIYSEDNRQLMAEILADKTTGIEKDSLNVPPFMEVYDSEDDAISKGIVEHMLGQDAASTPLPKLVEKDDRRQEEDEIKEVKNPMHAEDSVPLEEDRCEKISKLIFGAPDMDFVVTDDLIRDGVQSSNACSAGSRMIPKQENEEVNNEIVSTADDASRAKEVTEDKVQALLCKEDLSSNHIAKEDEYGYLSEIPPVNADDEKENLPNRPPNLNKEPNTNNSGTAALPSNKPKAGHDESEILRTNDQKNFEKNVLQKLAQQMEDNFLSQNSNASEAESSGLNRSSATFSNVELSLNQPGDEFIEELMLDGMQEQKEDDEVVGENRNMDGYGTGSKASSGYSSNGGGQGQLGDKSKDDQNVSIALSNKNESDQSVSCAVSNERSSRSSSSHDNQQSSDELTSSDKHVVIKAISGSSSSTNESVVTETDDSDRVPVSKKKKKASKSAFEKDSKYFSAVLEILLGKVGLRKLKSSLFDKFLYFNDLCMIQIDAEATEVHYMYFKSTRGSVQLSSRKKLGGKFSYEVDSAINQMMSRGLITKHDKNTFHIGKTFHYIDANLKKDASICKVTLHYRSICKRN